MRSSDTVTSSLMGIMYALSGKILLEGYVGHLYGWVFEAFRGWTGWIAGVHVQLQAEQDEHVSNVNMSSGVASARGVPVQSQSAGSEKRENNLNLNLNLNR